MKSIHLKNVRCFADARDVPIAPLTLLVGENSTGKSSFMALIRIAMQVAAGDLAPSFNNDPFYLGAYDQIAHFRGGRPGRARSFELGMDIDIKLPQRRGEGQHAVASWRSVFVKRGSQPSVSEFSFVCDSYRVSLKAGSTGISSIQIETPTHKELIDRDSLGPISTVKYFDPGMLHYVLVRASEKSAKQSRSNAPFAQEIDELASIIFHAFGRVVPSARAFAPVRSKPERTYNPIEDTPKAEGSHVPMVLAKIFFSDKEHWKELTERLDSFGRAAGLFEEINLRPLGKTESDPFQIMLKIAGPPTNLIDVGYGVSQVLPIVVDLFIDNDHKAYLLQQPEVHLHPRAQAELGTFLAAFAQRSESTIFVETHSDYILDRIRTEVRKDNGIKANDVLILFFERHGFDVQIHPIRLDQRGNLIGVPASYRQFFLKEEQLLLGIA